MWPWEHAGAGYLLYSVGRRLLGYDPPSDVGAIVVGVAAILPDLIDKPLSWELRLFPTGYGIGHSILFAVPLGLASVVLANRVGRRELGVAFVVGYWSHLVGDVLTPLRNSSRPLPGRVLWPLVTQEPYGQRLGIQRGFVYLATFLSSLDSVESVATYLAFPLVAALLWVADGVPGIRWLLGATARRLGRLYESYSRSSDR